jgi:hypothetical protein
MMPRCPDALEVIQKQCIKILGAEFLAFGRQTVVFPYHDHQDTELLLLSHFSACGVMKGGKEIYPMQEREETFITFEEPEGDFDLYPMYVDCHFMLQDYTSLAACKQIPAGAIKVDVRPIWNDGEGAEETDVSHYVSRPIRILMLFIFNLEYIGGTQIHFGKFCSVSAVYVWVFRPS